MLDHPAITNSEFTTAILTWMEGGLHWFTAPKPDQGIVLLDTYYLAYGLGIFGTYLLARHQQRKQRYRVLPYQVYDMVLVSIVSILVGAKLGFVVFYHPAYYIENPSQIVTNWSGMASHGAIVGLAVGFWIWARRIKVPWLHVLDNAAIGGAMGALYIRFANFLNGELYGRSVSPDLPWSMRFLMSDDIGQTLWVDADGKLYSLISKENGEVFDVRLVPYDKITSGFERLTDRLSEHVLIDGQTMPTEVWRAVTDARHPSQIYQLLLTGVVLATVLFFIRKRTTRVGTLAGSFFVGYGIIRFISEFFRQPDQQVGTVFLGLSMGQILSFAVIAVGVAILRYRAKHAPLITELPIPKPPTRASKQA